MPGALTRWDPFAELAELRTCFERLLDDVEPRGRMWMSAFTTRWPSSRSTSTASRYVGPGLREVPWKWRHRGSMIASAV